MTDRPLLALVMIVKNEARSIRALAESLLPFIDRWTILDTGSTDGTQAIVREVFANVEGELIEEPFVDFGTTRNRALELAGDKAVFTLMLSGDETVQGAAALRAFCEKHRDAKGPQHGAYYTKVHFGTLVYDHARLARAEAGWRYVGVTHEVLQKERTNAPSIRVPDVFIHHDVSHRNDKAMRGRWQLDEKLLAEAHRKQPKDTRTVFYLAQTYENLEQFIKAYQFYEKRARMGGWPEEVYESLFRKARTAEKLRKPWAEVQQMYLEAHSHSPHRAEPLYSIAWHYYQAKNHALTYLFASRGAQIPFPEKSSLFVDREVYHHKLLDLVGTAAYYVKEYDAGEAALRKALEALPGDARLQKNLAFYEDQKRQRNEKSERPERKRGERGERGERRETPAALAPDAAAVVVAVSPATPAEASATPAASAAPEASTAATPAAEATPAAPQTPPTDPATPPASN